MRMAHAREEIGQDGEGERGGDDVWESGYRKRDDGWRAGAKVLTSGVSSVGESLLIERERQGTSGLAFFSRFVANIRTSVSGRKVWTAPKYPRRF